MEIQKIAAFTKGSIGGNPAGVVLCSTLPPADQMQRVAAEVGFSETAFAAPSGDSGGSSSSNSRRNFWRVRYFAPEIEVPFCGHATIALGAALASRHGDGIYQLQLNDGVISVEGKTDGPLPSAALQSPATRSEHAPSALVSGALGLFSLTSQDLDARIPPALANAGATHLVLALRTHELLKAMHYDFAKGKQFMLAHGICTVTLLYAESEQRIHVRNPFASGGVYEDAATGAAAAALAGYLRDIDWPHHSHIDILQGDDMGVPSRLGVDISPIPGASIRVSGTARFMEESAPTPRLAVPQTTSA
jgi:PhzF family phenazine biosynthesis protein